MGSMTTEISVGSKVNFYQKKYFPYGENAMITGKILSVGWVKTPNSIIIELVDGGYFEIIDPEVEE